MVAVEGQNPAVFIHHWPHSNTHPATHALKCPNDKAQFVIELIHFKKVLPPAVLGKVALFSTLLDLWLLGRVPSV